MKRFALTTSAIALTLASGLALACGGDNSGKHMGTVLKVNPDANTITIRDAETSQPLTFHASEALIKGMPKAKNVVVDFEENSDGSMKATMVSPASF